MEGDKGGNNVHPNKVGHETNLVSVFVSYSGKTKEYIISKVKIIKKLLDYTCHRELKRNDPNVVGMPLYLPLSRYSRCWQAT